MKLIILLNAKEMIARAYDIYSINFNQYDSKYGRISSYITAFVV